MTTLANLSPTDAANRAFDKEVESSVIIGLAVAKMGEEFARALFVTGFISGCIYKSDVELAKLRRQHGTDFGLTDPAPYGPDDSGV